VIRRPGGRARLLRCAAAAGMLLLAGCAVEQKRTIKSSILAGLPGAQSGTAVSESNKRPSSNPQAAPTDGIRVELPDGDVVLHARSAWHVMVHIYQTLARGERDLFTQQVLSRKTREEFVDRGYDPAVAFDELKRRERDVLKLFNQFPYGEQTPGVFLESIGPNEFRLKARSPKGLRWSRMDLIIEDGEWRLRWFG
jgi:hypothetical protein